MGADRQGPGWHSPAASAVAIQWPPASVVYLSLMAIGHGGTLFVLRVRGFRRAFSVLNSCWAGSALAASRNTLQQLSLEGEAMRELKAGTTPQPVAFGMLD